MTLTRICTLRGVLGGLAVSTGMLLASQLPAAAQGPWRLGVATYFGPVSVAETQALKACLHNVAAPGKIRVKWTLLDNSSSRVPEAERATTLDMGTGACELFQPTASKTFIVKLELTREGPDSSAAGGQTEGQHVPGALPSLQITDRGGTTAIGLLLPAVQKVREAAAR